MALNKGNADCTAGLSKRIYDRKKTNIEAKTGWAILAQADKDAALAGLKENAWAEAQSHVEEIDDNAEIESGEGAYITGTLIATTYPVVTVPPATVHTVVTGGIK